MTLRVSLAEPVEATAQSITTSVAAAIVPRDDALGTRAELVPMCGVGVGGGGGDGGRGGTCGMVVVGGRGSDRCMSAVAPVVA